MKKMNAEQMKGWAAFTLFAVTCVILGENMLMNRSLNAALAAILVVSIVIAWLMNGARPDPSAGEGNDAELAHLDEGQ